jgi:hypothetical protein
MSSLPYPPNFDQNFDEVLHAERFARAVRMIDPGDVITAVEAMVAQITDPDRHPLAGVVRYYLSSGGPDTGRLPWNMDALAAAYDGLIKQALGRLIEEKLADFGAWGVD